MHCIIEDRGIEKKSAINPTRGELQPQLPTTATSTGYPPDAIMYGVPSYVAIRGMLTFSKL